MKLHTRIITYSLLFVLLAMTFFSCNTDKTPAFGTASTDGTDTVTENADKEPFVPYTLKHTTINLSDRLPHNIPKEFNSLGVTNDRNFYMKDRVLYLYTALDDSGAAKPMLHTFSVTDGTVEEAEIAVPMVGETAPFYAYPLADGRLIQFYEDAVLTDGRFVTESGFRITEADGTVLAEASYAPDFQYSSKKDTVELLVDENDAGDVTVLLKDRDADHAVQILCYRYDRAAGALTKTGMLPVGDDIPFFSLDSACVTGEQTYMSIAYRSSVVIDLAAGEVRQKELLLPSDKLGMDKFVDEDGQIYLYDALRLYRYRENEKPIEMAEWEQCDFASTIKIDLGQFFVVDTNTFFYTNAEQQNGETRNYLYCVQTEQVPDTDTRTLIRFDAYSPEDWLISAVASFNRTNTSYRVYLNIIDTLFMTEEEVETHLQERLMSEDKPDMIQMNLRYVSLDSYYEKNAFCDLSPYFGDTLLGCVRESLSRNGALYAVPMNMTLQTFVCTPEQDADILTWEEFFACIDALGENERITTEETAQSLVFDNGIMDFFDRESKSASYDTELFRKMVRYTADMNRYVDENDGYLQLNNGVFGYTNPTLPQRIADGGMKYVNVYINHPAQLTGLGLLFGERGYTWCGYPSNEGGGAELHAAYRTCVLADSTAKDGCTALLTCLLSDDMQTLPTHTNLPVTESALRKLLAGYRYSYYDVETYNAIGDPNASLIRTGIMLGMGGDVGYISLTPDFSTETRLDPEQCMETYPVRNTVTGETVTETRVKYAEVELTDAEIGKFMDFLNHCHMKAGTDPTVLQIVNEELSVWESGVKTLEDVTQIIQSRVSIYLNE
ncbi:MAG: hypothetical protein ACI3XM_10760 [Eubacteriales bacterium]